MSWAVPRPPRMWHVYLGEDQPPERRWQARILSILDAYSYFMVEAPSPGRPPVRAGAWAGIDEPAPIECRPGLQVHACHAWRLVCNPPAVR